MKPTASLSLTSLIDLPANKIWQNWASKNHPDAIKVGNTYRTVWNKNIANEAKQGLRRSKFESWLMEQGCYLEIKNGRPYIKGFDEDGLAILLLRWL